MQQLRALGVRGRYAERLDSMGGLDRSGLRYLRQVRPCVPQSVVAVGNTMNFVGFTSPALAVIVLVAAVILAVAGGR